MRDREATILDLTAKARRAQREETGDISFLVRIAILELRQFPQNRDRNDDKLDSYKSLQSITGLIMGCWGDLAFDNDTTNDWAASLARVDDLSLVTVALDELESVGDDYEENKPWRAAMADLRSRII